MAALLQLGLNPTAFDTNLARASEKMAAFEKKWVGVGQTFSSVNRGMIREQEQLFAAMDRLTAVQNQAQLERMANFQPEIILQREILGLRQSIAKIEDTTVQKIELQIQLEQKVLELEKMIAAEAARTAAAKEASAASSGGGPSAGAAEKPGDVQAVLERKFGLKDVFKGLLQGVGIAGVQEIANQMVEPFKASAESAQKIAEYTEASLASTRSLIALHQTDAQQLKTLENQIAEIRKEGERPAPRSWLHEQLAALARLTPLFAAFGTLSADAAATEQKRAQAKAEADAKDFEAEQKRLALKEKARALAEEDRQSILAELSTKDKVVAIEADIVRLRAEKIAKAKDGLAVEQIEADLRARDRELFTAIKELRSQTNLSEAQQLDLSRLSLQNRNLLSHEERVRLDVMQLQTRQLETHSELAHLAEIGYTNLNDREKARFNALVKQTDELDRQILKTQIVAQSEGEQMALAKIRLGLSKETQEVQNRILEISTLQTEQAKIQAQLAPLIKQGYDQLSAADKRRFDSLVLQNEKIGEEIGLKQSVIDKIHQVEAAENKVTAAIEASKTATDSFVASMDQLFQGISNVSKEWESFKGSVTSFGRGDKALSDRELSRKVDETKKDISARELQDQLSRIDPVMDFFLQQQKYNLAQVLGEITLRDNVRRTARTQGEDAAFAAFPGLSEQRFREILGTETKSQAIVDQLKKNGDDQSRGFNTLAQQILAASQRGKPLGG